MTSGGEGFSTDVRWGADAFDEERQSDFIADLTRRIVRQHELAERHARLFRQQGFSRNQRSAAGAPTST